MRYYSSTRVTVGHQKIPEDTIVTLRYNGVTRRYFSCTRVPGEPPGDTAVALGYKWCQQEKHFDLYQSLNRLPICHYSISWLPTVTLVSLWYLLVPSVIAVSPGGHTGTLISIQYLMVAHCYPRVTIVAYGGPLVF